MPNDFDKVYITNEKVINCIHCRGTGKIYFGTFGRTGYKRSCPIKCKRCNGKGKVFK